MRAGTPSTSQIFAILLPTTLPNVMPDKSDMAALIEMSNSGAEVPKATIVRPIMRCGMFIRTANDTAPRTRISPPKTSSESPATKKTYDIFADLRERLFLKDLKD